jgi:GMP synthase (glutamine-hydrolysing)
MTSVIAWRHVAFETLGTLERLFTQRGWTYSYLDIPTANLNAFDPLAPDLLVILGGPISVNDEVNYPFLPQEIALLKKRLAADKPTLGICLGAQLIARALGSRVYPGTAKEIGWSPLLLTVAGQASPIKYLAAQHTFMFHWHGETFDLPKDAVLLAGTETCLHQAFAWGQNTLAFQCHPEVRVNELENWFVGHALEIETSPAINVRKLRTDAHRYGRALEQQGEACFNQWLDGLGIA